MWEFTGSDKFEVTVEYNDDFGYPEYVQIDSEDQADTLTLTIENVEPMEDLNSTTLPVEDTIDEEPKKKERIMVRTSADRRARTTVRT